MILRLLLLLFFLPPVTHAATNHEFLIERGWQPQVEFAAKGQQGKAVAQLREIADLQRVLLTNTQFHKQTQLFVDQLWESFERFNLDRFYRMLPEQEGPWRALSLVGQRDGNFYRVAPLTDVQKLKGLRDAPAQLGDLSVQVQARKVESSESASIHYLLKTDMSLAVASEDWDSIVMATAETFRLVVEGDERFTQPDRFPETLDYINKVKEMNPDLEREDISIIAPLWVAFPRLWSLLASIGQVKDVVVADDQTTSYKKLNAAVRLELPKLTKVYPDLAKFLRKMDTLAEIDLDLRDEYGSVLKARLVSEDLTLHIETVVENGRILRMNNGSVVNVPDRFYRNKDWNLTAITNLKVAVYGVVVEMNEVKTHIRYQQMNEGVMISSRTFEVPQVKVSGSAFGILPTAMIDWVIPGDLETLLEEFMTVACHGNQGDGIVADLYYRQSAPESLSRLDVAVAFEGIDNFVVNSGMGLVNDRAIPGANESKALRHLIFDAVQAFTGDLETFARVLSAKMEAEQVDLVKARNEPESIVASQ